ncbi:uncharacterized protein LOC107041170 isoform X1 [Diachasma alloeum]|uniref:uncharacterized protein LOC107041170 isoform X1 n=1 Tax=Diachasma alloeum TaxID=454923 RepID=UPI0010FB12EC|nr:uncharacterized protein LOC107041170 isoform X1 [Diachasma alloeum]
MEEGEEKKRRMPLKYKGKFISQKSFDHKMRMKLAVAEAWKKRHERAQAESLRVMAEPVAQVETAKRPDFNTFVGSRIVDLEVLVKSLKCGKCKQFLSLQNLVHERRIGLYSVFNVWCLRCKIISEVHTGTVQIEGSRTQVPDINREIVHASCTGSVNADISCKSLNQFLDSLDIPTLSAKLFKKHKNELYATEEDASKECNGEGVDENDDSMREDNGEAPDENEDASRGENSQVLDENEDALREDNSQVLNGDENASKEDNNEALGENENVPQEDNVNAPDENENASKEDNNKIVDENEEALKDDNTQVPEGNENASRGENSQVLNEIENASEENSAKVLDENGSQQEMINS